MLVNEVHDDFNELVNQLKTVAIPDNLSEKVIAAVGRERRLARTVSGLLYAALALTAPALFLSIKLLLTDMAESPLRALLDLAITDWRQVQASFGSWVLAVFEGLPALSLALTLGAFFALLLLADRIVARARNNSWEEVTFR